MKKMNYLALFAFAVFVLSSCGSLNKMLDKASDVQYQVTPPVLVEKGGKVEVKVDVKYPAKYFLKTATMTVTPVIKYDGGETAFTNPLKLQGEGVQGNDKVINSVTGGSISWSGTVPFNEKMMKSQLVVRGVAELKGKKLDIPDYKIADGVIATSELVIVEPKPVMVGDNFKRIIPDAVIADIHYVINKADVRNSELKSEDIIKLQEFLAKASADAKIDLKNLELSAYASPDGALDLNDKLAQKRQGTADTYLQKELKKSKIQKAAQPGFVNKTYTAEDWDGFKQLMEKSDIQDKDLILRVLSMYSDPVVREKEIKNISKAFKVIADKVLPELRRSKFIVNVDKIGYSDDELKALFNSNPDVLKLEEILYTATLFDDLKTKLAVYQKAMANFPDCVRAANNVGYVYLLMGDAANAKTALEKAKAIKNIDAVNNNLACVAMLSGDLDKAKELFTASMGAGNNVSYNLGIIEIVKGDYIAAAKYFGNVDEFNTALVKYLNDDPDGALATINRIKGDFAKKDYLRAVVAAKQGKTDLIFESLRLAFAKDASLKNRAKVDMEFAKVFENETFKGLVK